MNFGLSSAQWHTIIFLPPVNCGMPRTPENGIIENIQSISTVGGAQIFFRCNPGFILAGGRRATCVSPDGISVVGIFFRCNARYVPARMTQ